MCGIGLAVLAVFPQEPADVPLTWHGAIHRHAALAGFVTVPLACLLLARHWRGRREWRSTIQALRWFAFAALVLLAVFVMTFLEPFNARSISGLVERLLLASHIALLAILGRRLVSADQAGRSDPVDENVPVTHPESAAPG